MNLARSFLFVPGSRPERFGKALESGADAVIVDLEDAVAPAAKDAARAALAAWLDPARPVLVRVNAAATPWFAADLELLARPGIAAVVLPKAERAADILALRRAGRGMPVLPLIESARGYHERHAIAATEGVARLVFGSLDFRVDLGMSCDEDGLLPFRAELVLASRLAGIAAPVDAPCPDIDDGARLDAETRRGRQLGFGGKLCIHPRQVAVVNRCFLPSAEELDWARRVLAADAGSGGAAVALDGKMVDKPVVLRARAILAGQPDDFSNPA